MAEDKIKKQNEEQLQDEQLDEISGGTGISMFKRTN